MKFVDPKSVHIFIADSNIGKPTEVLEKHKVVRNLDDYTTI